MRFTTPATHDSAPTPDSVLAGLDVDQRAAVTAPTGVVVVRAGAGSGKTTVLTRRIAWRALNGTADIERTLAITFTRQAATEMRTRLASFDLDGRPIIGTFHAVARRILLQHLEDRGKRAPLIINNRSTLLMTCMGDDARKGGVSDILNAIDWAHARMISPSQSAAALDKAGLTVPLGARRFTEVFEEYERVKKKRGVIDLNDFMTLIVNESARDPRLVESVRFQYRHISVDEAQDMNPLQYAFLRVLLPESPDLFLVGDPNQAIYGFNGADKDLFESLPRITSGAHVVSLPSNYRCTPEIVTMAVATLARDGQVADAISQRPPGQSVRLERCADETKEREFICKTVLRARGSHRSWSDIAVLTRINAHADAIREDLTKMGIPVRSSRRGGAWGRAVSAATELTSREALTEFAADILDTGDYNPDDADFIVATMVRDFLDNHRSGSVDGRTFGSWLATSSDVSEVEGVDVLTFHAAKGREWSLVVVAGAEKGLLPYRSARSPQARSEEARLAYVALTRAADELIVTWTDQRNGKPSGPSPLLPSVTTASPIVDAPPAEFRAVASRKSTRDPIVEALDAWRRRHARTARIEPDGVLNKRQMKALAFQKPKTIEEIAHILDDVFAARFGEEIIAVVSAATN